LLVRIAFATLVVFSLWLSGAPRAWAHGGNFRTDGPQGPGLDTPQIGPSRAPPVTTARATWLAGDWQTWWRLNGEALLPDKRGVRRRVQASAPRGLFQVGRTGGPRLSLWERAVTRGAVETAVPFLLELLDPQTPQDPRIVAAALLALGRIARDKQPISTLEHYAARTNVRLEVRESAVLGLGLLRRTDRAARLDLATLTEVRSFLIHLFDDKDAPDRVRAFAVYSLALLADQPYPDTPLQRDGRRVTRFLWQRLRHRYPAAELPVALLTALGRQPAPGVPSGVLEGLRAIATNHPFRGRRWNAMWRSHALTAYVRLGGPEWLPIIFRVLRGARDHVAVRVAAALALRQRASRLDADERDQAARSLYKLLPREPHWFAAGLEQIALASLLREDVRHGSTRLIERTPVGRYLEREAMRGRTMSRPYAALALGIACHGLKPTNRASALTLKRLRTALTKGLRFGRGSDDVLAAFAVGLGLARAQGAHGVLLGILGDRSRSGRLRGHCAVALAQIGRATPGLEEALHAAAAERVSPYVHTGAVRALSLLAAPGTAQRLLAQLKTTRSRFSIAVVAGALGRFGDPAATRALVQLARDKVAGMGVRTMAVVALGLIFDPEPRPSRVLMTTDANYPSRTSALTQVFNIM